MSIFQKISLYLTALFLGTKASFEFHAGSHVYSVSIVYTAEHSVLTMAQIIAAVESFVVGGAQFPYSFTAGNTSLTISLVS
jgi:hypothetical protein